MRIFEHEPLAPRTTFNVGGSARFLIEAESEEDIRDAFAFARTQGLPVRILGGGSNILVDDGEAQAVVIHVAMRGAVFTPTGECVVGAGHAFDAVVAEAVARGFFGLETLSGIPGTVGGAVVQNAGAYGAEVKDHLSYIEAYDAVAERFVRLTKEECGLSYRSSRFKEEPGRFVILRVSFRLPTSGEPNIVYRDLKERFKESTPSLTQVREAVLQIRAGKFPDLRVEGTAGSFFKNPIMTAAQVGALKGRFPELPVFPQGDGSTAKVSLAWLLDHALGYRGKQEGFVRAYEKQPLVVVAERGARASDVRAFAKRIALRVHNELGISVTPEVIIMRSAAETYEL